MRRALLLCLLFLAGAPRPPRGGEREAARVRPALAAQDRSATFEARVRPRAGSERMQVRFTLQVREGALPAGGASSRPGLDEWLTSLPA